jgi:beta-galactosidase/beta-glucuronidase
MDIPRNEYPRPQFVRPEWRCLNGEWQFEMDQGDSGLERGLLARPLNDKITVPFCPESQLSGIGNTDYQNAVWYRREIEVPAAWSGQRVLLHLQACDYDTTIWVDGRKVRRHRGGFTPITCTLRDSSESQTAFSVVVRARDGSVAPQPRGKQPLELLPSGCLYYRTTGIWQTVWIEPVPASYLGRPRITPSVAHNTLTVACPVIGSRPDQRLVVRLRDERGPVVEGCCPLGSDLTPSVTLAIPEDRRRLWSIEDPFLYDLEIELQDASGAVADAAASYAGLRSVTLDGKAIKLNGRVVFQRLVLDQGYYPDGILTAPSDEALRQDIELSMAAGFNGARLHQKVFEERFLYWADKLGYLVWGEFPDWGCRTGGWPNDHQKPGPSYITEWLEALERDYSHPAIVGWCPLNETWQELSDQVTMLDDVTWGMYLATKALDSTRPVLDASGYSHRVYDADVYDCHDYEQDPTRFAQNHAGLAAGQPHYNQGPARGRWSQPAPWSIPYAGQPFFVSEFGGIWWNAQAAHGADSWGYGERCRTIEEVYARFEGLCNVLLDDPGMFGYCYTQLTDVWQEQNGVLNFDRTKKLDLERLRRIQQRKAAIERG